jgi:hypothetical protein
MWCKSGGNLRAERPQPEQLWKGRRGEKRDYRVLTPSSLFGIMDIETGRQGAEGMPG